MKLKVWLQLAYLQNLLQPIAGTDDGDANKSTQAQKWNPKQRESV